VFLRSDLRWKNSHLPRLLSRIGAAEAATRKRWISWQALRDGWQSR